MASASTLVLKAGEYAPYYGRYIDQIGDQDIVALLTTQATALDSLARLEDTRARHRYADGKWSVKEVVGHITDAERVFAYRMLRIARADATPLAGFEQEDYVRAARFDRLPIAQLVDSFHAARASTLALIAEIDDDAWPRMGTASGFPVSARAFPYLIAGHATHHIGILRSSYGMPV